VFITAGEGLVDRAHVTKGQKVLVQGGAGGVGHIVVQLAKAFGAQVFATGSTHHQSLLASFGAVPIDYQRHSVDDYVAQHTEGEGFDVVYDTVGGRVLDDSFKAVKRFGHVVSALGWGTHALAPLSFKAGTYSGVFTLLPLLTGIGREHHGQILREATALAERGQLVPRVDPRPFSILTANDAHAAAAGHTDGKIVVEIPAEK